MKQNIHTHCRHKHFFGLVAVQEQGRRMRNHVVTVTDQHQKFRLPAATASKLMKKREIQVGERVYMWAKGKRDAGEKNVVLLPVVVVDAMSVMPEISLPLMFVCL